MNRIKTAFLLFQKKVADIQAAHPNNRVAVAVAIGNNQVVPETLTVTSDTHFVVWLVLGTKPNLVFKGAAPFTFTCQDFLCYSDAAASSGGQAKVNVEYDLTFTAIGGAPVKADPHLEVVK